jgi:Fe-S cluster biosynthesis and repair protein YggX
METEQTIELLKPCNTGVKINILESFWTHILQKQTLLIEKQKVNDPNPLYNLAQDVAAHN